MFDFKKMTKDTTFSNLKDSELENLYCDNDILKNKEKIFNLMIENQITLSYDQLNQNWMAISQFFLNKDEANNIISSFSTLSNDLFKNYVVVNNKPLRAILECYLLIKQLPKNFEPYSFNDINELTDKFSRFKNNYF